MSGGKKRTSVVYVDGIPIKSSVFNDSKNSSKVANQGKSETFNVLDARQLFEKYDKDRSGGIDFHEFQMLLHDLNIKLAEPKALTYFKKCDKEKKGFISFQEFRICLFTCDPNNPSRTGGFHPGQGLCPKDLFEMFDKNEQEALDRDAFMQLFEFIGVHLSLERAEELFAYYEDRQDETIGYEQFKKIWLQVIDVRQELRNRGEKFHPLLPTSTLVKRLEIILSQEEQQEARTLFEGAATLEDEKIAAERRWIVDECLLLSHQVLAEALDAAGQVYMFGKGPFGRFDGMPVEPDFADFLDYDLVRDLWRERVRPRTDNAQANGDKDDEELSITANVNASWSSTSPEPVSISRTRTLLKNQIKKFSNRYVSLVTAFLWGKRVKQVCCGAVVAYAITDFGEVFCWGGNKRYWQYFYDDTTFASDDLRDEINEDTNLYKTVHETKMLSLKKPVITRQLTTRSEMLRLALPKQNEESEQNQYASLIREKYQRAYIKPVRLHKSEVEKQTMMTQVGQYYEVFSSDVTSGENATSPHLICMVESALNVDDLVLSLQIRGVYADKMTRTQLVEAVGDCIALESECMGEKFHYYMKEQDKVARQARHERRTQQLLKLIASVSALWIELRVLQKKIKQAEIEFHKNQEANFQTLKKHIFREKQRLRRQAREGFHPSTKSIFYASGLTSRGNPVEYFNGNQGIETMAIGSRHILAIRLTGKLYTWGVGTFGRLGIRSEQSKDDIDAWHRDYATPQLIPKLQHTFFRSVACGYSHSLALSTDGQVYVWGSATHGKLGVGPIPHATECFSLEPLCLQLGAGTKVRKIACGPSHSAVLTTEGKLYVWGSGDGGKLGLGDDRIVGEDHVPRNGEKMGFVMQPTLVISPFENEKLVEVSCGTAHTAVLTSVTHDALCETFEGGKLYIAGSCHALGSFTPSFIPFSRGSIANIPMIKVSCGNAHTGVVSAYGELFTWGNNPNGCTGHPIAIPRINEPMRVSCLYQASINLCTLDQVQAYQSTQTGPYSAQNALTSSVNEYSQTQYERCPFWQVNLGRISRIEQVAIEFKPHSMYHNADGLVSDRKTSRTQRGSSSWKYVVMVSMEPFEEESSEYNAAQPKNHSVSTSFSLPPGTTSWRWNMPADTFGQYIRVQLESSTGILGLVQVMIMGLPANEHKGSRVNDVVCAENLTIAISRPVASLEVLEHRYRRAVRADSNLYYILAQLETYHPFLEQTKESLDAPCMLCKPRAKCVICKLDDAVFDRRDGKKCPKNQLIEERPIMSLELLCQKLLTKGLRVENAVSLDSDDKILHLNQCESHDIDNRTGSISPSFNAPIVVKERQPWLQKLRRIFQLPSSHA